VPDVRGNSVATVLPLAVRIVMTKHYFARPEEMIRGAVVDPRLTLDNLEMCDATCWHYLLQQVSQRNPARPIESAAQPQLATSFLSSAPSSDSSIATESLNMKLCRLAQDERRADI